MDAVTFEPPFAEAVIVASPSAEVLIDTAPALTVATLVLLLDQDTVLSVAPSGVTVGVNVSVLLELLMSIVMTSFSGVKFALASESPVAGVPVLYVKANVAFVYFQFEPEARDPVFFITMPKKPEHESKLNVQVAELPVNV